MNDTSMAACTTSSFDLIAACRALSTLAAVNSSAVPALAKVVENISSRARGNATSSQNMRSARHAASSCKACADECHKVAA